MAGVAGLREVCDFNMLPKNYGDVLTDFTLSDARGKLYRSQPIRSKGLLLMVLFEADCSTCQFSAPYFQRFHRLYAEPSLGKFQIWGLSQDGEEITNEFGEQFGITFPLLLDDRLEVTEDYAITNVPDLYLLDSGAQIRGAVVGGFSRAGFNGLAKQIAEYLQVPYQPVVRDDEVTPALKPG